MIATETELAKFKELSESRLKEIEELQKDLKESQRINGTVYMTSSFILVYSYHFNSSK